MSTGSTSGSRQTDTLPSVPPVASNVPSGLTVDRRQVVGFAAQEADDGAGAGELADERAARLGTVVEAAGLDGEQQTEVQARRPTPASRVSRCAVASRA